MDMLVFCAVALMVMVGCLVPNAWLPRMPNDKLMHFGAFALLTLLAGRMANDAVSMGLWLAGLFVAGWLVECLQNFVTDRSFSWADIAANSGGIAAAVLAQQMFAHRA